MNKKANTKMFSKKLKGRLQPVRINKEIKTLDEDIVLKKTFKSTIEIVVDRLVMKRIRLKTRRLN